MVRVSSRRPSVWLGLMTAVVMAVAVQPSAFGAERVVVGEEFTATW